MDKVAVLPAPATQPNTSSSEEGAAMLLLAACSGCGTGKCRGLEACSVTVKKAGREDKGVAIGVRKDEGERSLCDRKCFQERGAVVPGSPIICTYHKFTSTYPANAPIRHCGPAFTTITRSHLTMGSFSSVSLPSTLPHQVLC